MKISKISEDSFLVDNGERKELWESHLLGCNSEGKGLWIDGRQVKGTDDFIWGKNKKITVKKVFEKLSKMEDL